MRAERAVDAGAADAHERAEGEYGPVGGGGVVAAVGAAEVGLLEQGGHADVLLARRLHGEGESMAMGAIDGLREVGGV